MSGKLFHTLTIRSLKNLARTVVEGCFYTAYTGRSPVQAEGPAGCGQSKIARVCAYYLYVLYVVAAAD